jgi:DNA-binding Lrp family transcriptional regulator
LLDQQAGDRLHAGQQNRPGTGAEAVGQVIRLLYWVVCGGGHEGDPSFRTITRQSLDPLDQAGQLPDDQLRILHNYGCPDPGGLTAVTSIDALDADLIAALSEDPRMGPTELSQRLRVSRNTVHARLTRLASARILDGFSARVHLPALGLAVEAFVDVELAQGALQAVIDSVAEIPNVLEVNATTGRGDLVVRVTARTHEELQALLQDILAIDGLMRTTTRVVLTTPVPYRVAPMLAHITGTAGRGRSGTPRRGGSSRRTRSPASRRI